MQDEISFIIKIHINIALILSKKSHGLQKNIFIEKKFFFSVYYVKIIE